MRVKVQFTVDIEEVPSEVSKRIQDIVYDYENSSQIIKDSLKDIHEENIIEAIKKIDDVRKKIAIYDSVLEDGYSVLVGLANYRTKQLEKSLKKVSDTVEEAENVIE